MSLSEHITLDEFESCAGVKRLWAEGKAIAVAVSGGPDSLALCKLLSLYAEKHNGPGVRAVTVDHGLRPEAAEEARQVEQQLKDWPYVQHCILTCQPDPKESSSSSSFSSPLSSLPPLSSNQKSPPQSRIMENAREGRYRVLAEHCQTHGLTKLFVAHHQDDQAETFLFRLAKGSGLDGLAAMRPVYVYGDFLQIIRPLLNYPKTRLIETCKSQNISYVEDPTNKNKNFARTRLRASQDILAEEGLTPKRLFVTASRLARAREALEYYTENILQRSILKRRVGEINEMDRAHGKDEMSLCFLTLHEQPDEIRLRVIIQAMKILSKDWGYGPRMEKLENLVERLFTEETFKSATLGGILVALDRKRECITLKKEIRS